MSSGEDESAGGGGSSRSRAQSSGGGPHQHYLAKCVLRGSAVLHIACGHIRSPLTLDLVFGKETSLELVVVGEDGIVQSVSEQTVFGIIKDLAILRWNERFHQSTLQRRGKDLLVVLSDSGKLSFLTFSTEMHRFFAVSHIQLSAPGNSRHQLGRMLAVDPEGCFVAVSAYDDRFALLPVSRTDGNNIVEEKITYPPENEVEANALKDTTNTYFRGTIWSMCFLPNENKEGYNSLLAVLMNRKSTCENEIVLFGCILRTRSIHVICRYSEAGPLVHHISAVPHLSGFVLLFRTGDIILLDIRNPYTLCSVHKMNLDLASTIEELSPFEDSCRGLDIDDEGMSNVACALLELRDSGDDMVKDDDPMNIDSGSGKSLSTSKYVVSWSWEPFGSTNSKLIICLDTGEIHILEISSDVSGIKINFSDCIYSGLPCKILFWFKDDLIIGIADMGDGMVLKLEQGKRIIKFPIQNIAPILDFSVVDYHDEKQDQIFACCGMSPEGSIRIIRNGISVEKLLRTPPIYKGITGTWTLQMKKSDPYHSFLVLSFVEETRVLSVGLSFNDVTDAAGFLPDVCTLACGLVADGLLVQVHKAGVRLCVPTTSGHPGGVPLSTPVYTSWHPDSMSISLGAVGHNFIVVSTSNPCFLFILGVRSISTYHFEIYEIQHVRLQHEVSCISIPRESISHECLSSKTIIVQEGLQSAVQHTIPIGFSFVIGTHKPSVEILSYGFDNGLRVLAIGTISINNELGTPVSGCIPEDVRLVSSNKSYILSGLRNGMLLRYEWPDTSSVSKEGRHNHFGMRYCSKKDAPSPSTTASSFGNLKRNAKDSEADILQLIAVRRVGITPVMLIPLYDSLDADIIVLSDRPWLLHSARHSLAYTSVSFQLATHATPVNSADCPKGILFVAENSLHLVEMVHTKRLNVQKFSIGGTPRKILFHHESKTLLVLRTGLTGACSSDICRVDPLSGSLLSKFPCEPGETAKSMQIVKVGIKDVLVVGTSQFAGRMIMPTGEAESAKGRIIVLSLDTTQRPLDGSSSLGLPSQISSPFGEIVGYATEQLSSSSICSSPDEISSNEVKLEETEAPYLRLLFQIPMPGAVLSVCPYLDRYFLASAGNIVSIFGFLNDIPQRLKKFAMAKTRFAVTCLATCFTRIAVGDCRDGVLFFSYHEDLRKLEQIYSDPVQRLVADCALVDMDTVVVSDRRGNISVLSCTDHLEGNESPEKNLMLNCSFYLGEAIMSMQKGLFSYRLPVDDAMKKYNGTVVAFESSYNSIVAGTLLGSVLIMIPITRDEHQLLEAVQSKLAVHPLTSPVLGNDHREFRGRGPLVGPTMLDGNLLAQFLELTSMQQEAVLAITPPNSQATTSNSCQTDHPYISVSEVVRVLERVHYTLS